MEEFVIAVLADAAERHQQERIRLRELRGNSNPFELTETKFKKMFRLPKAAAQHLCLVLTNEELNRRAIPKEIKVLASLNFFTHGSYQAHVGEDSLLGLSQPSVSRCVNTTAAAIVAELAHSTIKFPHTVQEKNAVKALFLEKYGMPNVLGAVDGTHVAITKPPLNHPTAPGSLFYNRKGFYSINCQIVTDANGKIISINPNFPGSMHDAAIWALSDVHRKLERDYINGERNQWLLGDKGYPLQPWLMTPVLRAETEPEQRYNACHKSARNIAEMTYGRLKNKLRCLHKHRTLYYDPVTAAKIIVACCVLYNTFCDVFLDDDDDEDHNADDGNNNDDNIEGPFQNDFLNEARNIREGLINNFFAN